MAHGDTMSEVQHKAIAVQSWRAEKLTEPQNL
jgi:hypothetical protein